jgi:hypothetical protein
MRPAGNSELRFAAPARLRRLLALGIGSDASTGLGFAGIGVVGAIYGMRGIVVSLCDYTSDFAEPCLKLIIKPYHNIAKKEKNVTT